MGMQAYTSFYYEKLNCYKRCFTIGQVVASAEVQYGSWEVAADTFVGQSRESAAEGTRRKAETRTDLVDEGESTVSVETYHAPNNSVICFGLKTKFRF